MGDSDWDNLPIFRSISPATMKSLGAHARRRSEVPGVELIREGEMAGSMFVLAMGNCVVTHKGEKEPIGVLEGPTLFGEMALVAATPRLAGVTTSSSCLLFELPRDPVFAAASADGRLRELILGYHHDRLWRSVFAASPIFSALGEARMRALAADLVPATFGAGVTLLTEGSPGAGLFILLRGRCEVIKGLGKDAKVVAELSEGDLFGEISLVLFDKECTATVRTKSEAVVLQLSRDNFQRIIMSEPETRARIVKLALQRLNDKVSDVRKPAII